MTYENNKFSDDLEQIIRRQRSSSESLEKLKQAVPDYAEDFAAMQEKSAQIINGLAEIAGRCAEDFEEFDDEKT